LTLLSCTPQVRIAYLDSGTLSKISEKNRQVCAYKGKIVINYQDEHSEIRLKGYLDKECNKDFHLVILGPLNIVMAYITYKGGEVKANKNGEDISLMADYFFKSKNVDTIVELIRYPYVEVDAGYSIKAEDGRFIIQKDDVLVVADADYLIKEISDSKRKFVYGYEDGKINNILYEYKKQKIEIGLR
jgi:hypothetical protein